MDINASTLRSIYTGLSLAYNRRFESAQTYYNIVAMTVPSATAFNEYPRMDDLPGFREWIGDRVVHDIGGQTYIIRNKTYEKTIGIKRDNIEDDQLGIYSQVAAQHGQGAAEFPDQLVFPLLKKGDTTLCYDGQYFFDTDHPGYSATGAPASVSNFTAGAGAAWYLIDDTQVMKPIVYQQRRPFKLTALQNEHDPNVWMQNMFIWSVDGRCNAGYGLWQLAHKSKATLDETNFMAAYTAMTTIRRRDGSVISIRPSKLLVPPTLLLIAKKLLENTFVNGGDSNPLSKLVEVIPIPYLA